MAVFTGQLRANEVYGSIFNMIISQQVFADDIKGTNSTLLDLARVDGTLFGDTKTFYATDCNKTQEWLGDAESANLLDIKRDNSVQVQSIILDQFRMVWITVDQYLSKRAWMNSGAFLEFNSRIISWLRDTKRVFESLTYNVFIGTDKSVAIADTAVKGQKVKTYEIDINANGNSTGENVAEGLANLFTDMTDVTRDFNDYQYLRSYSMSDFKVIWNSRFVNSIKRIDLPSIFHNQDLIDKFADYVLPARFFGDIQAAVTAGNNDGTYRSTIETDYTVDEEEIHVFPADFIPAGVAIAAGESYKTNEDIICKVYVKLPIFMSGFETETTFFNQRGLNENHYLICAYNTLEHFYNYPVVEVKVKPTI